MNSNEIIKNIKSLSVALYVIDSKGMGNISLDGLERLEVKLAIQAALALLEKEQRDN